ncbi:MAG: DUF6152 family protein [Gammaproteobacteria bacterium]|nr:DUF6152 family protein [Gammaproteobacteria bacterium]
MRKLIYSLVLASSASLAGSATAHHSFAAEFSYEDFGSREGEVVEVHFVNPHARIFLAVTNANGEEEIWDAQTFPPRNLIANGWHRDTINVGDRITIEGNLGLEGSFKLWIISMTLEDGTEILPNGGRAN